MEDLYVIGIIGGIMLLVWFYCKISYRMRERKYVPSMYYWFEFLQSDWKPRLIIRREMQDFTMASCRLEVIEDDMKKLSSKGLVEFGTIAIGGFQRVPAYRLTLAGRKLQIEKPFFWRQDIKNLKLA